METLPFVLPIPDRTKPDRVAQVESLPPSRRAPPLPLGPIANPQFRICIGLTGEIFKEVFEVMALHKNLKLRFRPHLDAEAKSFNTNTAGFPGDRTGPGRQCLAFPFAPPRGFPLAPPPVTSSSSYWLHGRKKKAHFELQSSDHAQAT